MFVVCRIGLSTIQSCAVLLVVPSGAYILPPEADAMLAWPHSGFHVHHHVRIDAGDPDGRAHVARYAARAPVSLSV